MERTEQKEMKKKRPTWYDWSINYIPEPIRKIVGSFKDKVVSLFKINTPKNCSKKTVYRHETKPSKPI